MRLASWIGLGWPGNSIFFGIAIIAYIWYICDKFELWLLGFIQAGVCMLIWSVWVAVTSFALLASKTILVIDWHLVDIIGVILGAISFTLKQKGWTELFIK